MQGVDYIALAIPFFFLLIFIEWLAARWLDRDVYRLNDSINDLHTGILQQVLGIFVKAVTFGAYVVVFELSSRWELSASSAWVWIVCFLAVDHQYYWFHRISHEVNLPWGAHIVHHSSEEFNLAVALRQGAFQPLFSWIFYIPLAVIGFPPLVFLTCSSFNTIYQFWIHTRLIDRLGPLEWVLNTPSHHRVHHGCDEKYLDRNYAGALIIWDRLYGSFQIEEEEPTYGITKPLASWNPLWANLHYYKDLADMTAAAPSWSEKLKVWWKGPSWKPAWKPDGPGRTPEVSPLSHGPAGRFDARAPRRLIGYLVAQFLLANLLTVILLFLQRHLTLWQQALLALLIVWTCLNVGAFFELKSWLLGSEVLRLSALAVVAVVLLSIFWPQLTAWAVVGAAIFWSFNLAILLRGRRLG